MVIFAGPLFRLPHWHCTDAELQRKTGPGIDREWKGGDEDSSGAPSSHCKGKEETQDMGFFPSSSATFPITSSAMVAPEQQR